MQTLTALPPEHPNIEPLLKKDQVAHHLGITPRALDRMIARGDFPEPIRIGTRFSRYRRVTIEAFLASLETH